MNLRFHRGVRYWRKNHPMMAKDARLLADIATDHTDWTDEDVIARLAAERLGPGRL